MEAFRMVRENDFSGVSGTGHVLDGVIFDDGVTVVRWRTKKGSTAVYNNFKEFEDIHINSHPTNATKIEWYFKGKIHEVLDS